jgi:uncharacterized protein (DUF1015 family)
VVCYDRRVPGFEPFVGLRYGPDATDLSGVVCPPYDVITEEQRRALEERHEVNCVRLELPVGEDRYRRAAEVLSSWRQPGGPLVADDGPSFYVYAMGFVDESGARRQTTGVLGALRLGDGVLPHERTTPKDVADRLELLRATRTNLSPIWGLSLASGLSMLCEPAGPPDARATADGVHHRLWRVTAPGVVSAIAEAVSSAPVVVADGHHRYEVAGAYRASLREGEGERGGGGGGEGAGHGGPEDLVLAYVVELAEEQLAVAPIHRLLSGLPVGWDPEVVLEPWFTMAPTASADAAIGRRMAEAGAMCLVTPKGQWLLHPRPASSEAAEMDLDSSRLAVVLDGLPDVRVRYQPGWADAVTAVSAGEADAAVLVRPATVTQIAAVARAGGRMPPKTTFFTPKPATGMVFRSMDDQVAG